MKQEFYEQLKEIIEEQDILVDEPMKKHTTFRIGGPADFFVTPKSIEEVQKLLELCKSNGVPYYILGNGSNLLVGDKGYRGVVIQIYKKMNGIVFEGTRMKAQAGALLVRAASEAYAHALTGLEFASGIPGTIGGAVVMNAGAYGGEIKDCILSATVLTDENEVLVLKREELELGYRTSIVSRKGFVVLEAEIELAQGNQEEMRERLEELREQRVTKQPLEYPSAGSTFKRPEGYFAGKLIQDAGLKGFRVGDAQVSEKHSGFVINRGQATAAEVVSLMEQVSEKVNKQFGVILEPEVKRLGEF
ncbi:UDP-N-acetylmuramate dehydrogenase [Lachnospiraceae bacterium OttesenSCG-928-E19]|nr:UDP-N-acetylmuramate dehydrogenase [Lachnospiraceae bacterium OttesenSCG-928-E19]